MLLASLVRGPNLLMELDDEFEKYTYNKMATKAMIRLFACAMLLTRLFFYRYMVSRSQKQNIANIKSKAFHKIS